MTKGYHRSIIKHCWLLRTAPVDSHNHEITCPSAPLWDQGSLQRHDHASESSHGLRRRCARLSDQDASTNSRARKARLGRFMLYGERIQSWGDSFGINWLYLLSPGVSSNLGITFYRLWVLSCGFWLLFRHAQKFKLEPMRNLTAWLAEMVGQVQRTSNAFRTSEPSSRRYATELQPFIVSLIAICIFRWSAPVRRFGYHRRTIRQKTSYTTGCTFRRTQRSF